MVTFKVVHTAWANPPRTEKWPYLCDQSAVLDEPKDSFNNDPYLRNRAIFQGEEILH